MEQEIAELQTQLAFHEDTLQTLNTIVTEQQQQIDTLSREIQFLSMQIRQLGEAMQRPASEEPPPPHY